MVRDRGNEAEAVEGLASHHSCCPQTHNPWNVDLERYPSNESVLESTRFFRQSRSAARSRARTVAVCRGQPALHRRGRFYRGFYVIAGIAIEPVAAPDGGRITVFRVDTSHQRPPRVSLVVH